MRRIWLVLKNEFLSTVNKRSFWLTTILFPALVLGLTLGAQFLGWHAAAEADQLIPQAGTQAPLGYVDHSGIIQRLPAEVGSGAVVAYADEEAAREAVIRGAVSRFAVIPSDYLSGGAVTITAEKFRPVDSFGFPPVLEYVLNYNLLGDAGRARLLFAPLAHTTQEPMSGADAGATDNQWAFLVPYAVLMIFYFVIIMSSSYMLQSMVREKENRTVEMLLLSVKPRELMSGKILGLAAVGLVQMTIWLGGGLAVLNRAAPRLAEMGFERSLPPSFVAWSLAFFVVGYLLFAALLGALGGLAPGTREGNQFVFVAIAPLIIPMLMSSNIIRDPNGDLAVFLSLFPLTSTVTMPTRLAATDVPIWQLVLGLVLLAVGAYLLVLFAARLVRSDTLLATKRLNLKRVVSELRAGR